MKLYSKKIYTRHCLFLVFLLNYHLYGSNDVSLKLKQHITQPEQAQYLIQTLQEKNLLQKIDCAYQYHLKTHISYEATAYIKYDGNKFTFLEIGNHKPESSSPYLFASKKYPDFFIQFILDKHIQSPSKDTLLNRFEEEKKKCTQASTFLNTLLTDSTLTTSNLFFFLETLF